MRITIFVLIFLHHGVVFSQKEMATQPACWLIINGNHKVQERWGIHSEYQLRRSEFLREPMQYFIRLGVDYYSPKSGQFTVGYGWFHTMPYGEQPVGHVTDEHRMWQQYQYKTNLTRMELIHRYRLEQRWIENWGSINNTDVTQNGHIFRQRIRYRFLLNYPLTRKYFEDNTLFMSVSDEVFLGFGKGIGKNVLDQNRFYAGLGWRFTKNLQFQLGYLNQFIIKSDGVHIERNHTLQASLTLQADFSK